MSAFRWLFSGLDLLGDIYRRCSPRMASGDYNGSAQLHSVISVRKCSAGDYRRKIYGATTDAACI